MKWLSGASKTKWLPQRAAHHVEILQQCQPAIEVCAEIFRRLEQPRHTYKFWSAKLNPVMAIVTSHRSKPRVNRHPTQARPRVKAPKRYYLLTGFHEKGP